LTTTTFWVARAVLGVGIDPALFNIGSALTGECRFKSCATGQHRIEPLFP
jgi:hypothetical protein